MGGATPFSLPPETESPNVMELIPMDDDRVVAVRIDGTIREADVRAMVDVIEDKLTRHPKLRAYVELVHLGGIEPVALLEELKMGLRHWDRFERKASVTDARWIARIAEAVDPLFPSITVRVFALAEREAALAWITEGAEGDAGRAAAL